MDLLMAAMEELAARAEAVVAQPVAVELAEMEV